MEWDKVSANDATKRLISKMYEQIIHFNNKNNWIKNGQKT